ncbi:hypothetical protein TELCIR_04088 [Teladorsagia circumcincta]|uniref:Uncharacterized protein n=1 Tax=Teladorsagia circumcincta TaxID=45464 RepID=A0A2G9UUJ4_TELCI|nr:hypothetical protein TELCIR_04088 [Teladorsagia circumcincta]
MISLFFILGTIARLVISRFAAKGLAWCSLKKIGDGARNSKSLTGIAVLIDDKWLHISEDTILNHPGGAVIRQYANADATQIFQAFHEGSNKAFKQLEVSQKYS